MSMLWVLTSLGTASLGGIATCPPLGHRHSVIPVWELRVGRRLIISPLVVDHCTGRRWRVGPDLNTPTEPVD